MRSKEKKRVFCQASKKCKDSYASWLFFIIGLIATIAVRFGAVLMDVNPLYAKIAWYIGVGGFLAFFIYKFRVNYQRAKIIGERDLLVKAVGQQPFTKEDYDIMTTILSSVSSRKEMTNFFFIFVFSALALGWALYIDFFR